MINKSEEIKKCLTTFGYRKLNDTTYCKPIAFIAAIARIEESCVIFEILFKSFSTSDTCIYSHRQMDYNDYMFESNENLSKAIASYEVELFGNCNGMFCGLNNMPWNFHTIGDILQY